MTYSDFLLWYARHGVISSIKRSAFRKFCRRNAGKKFISVCENGFQMHTVLGDSVDNKIAVYSVFEPGTSSVLAALIPTCDSFVDVGCNIGYFSCMFAAINPAKQVLAIDPNPEMIWRSEENLALNQAQNYRLLNCGIGRERGNAQLHIPSNRHSLSSFAYAAEQGGSIKSIDCEILPLSEVLDSHAIEKCFLKIDTEGYEQAVLSGIAPAQFENINYVLFEHSCENVARAQVDSSDMFALKIFQIYDLYQINEESEPRILKTTAQDVVQNPDFNGNLLMVHQSQRANFSQVMEHFLV